MPFAEVPAFIADLRQRKAVTALALEFGILTAARPGEVFGATWPEIDRDAEAIPWLARDQLNTAAASAARADELRFLRADELRLDFHALSWGRANESETHLLDHPARDA